MPNAIQAALARYAPKTLALVGVSIGWKGGTYTAGAMDAQAIAELETGGFSVSGDFVLKIPRVAFAAGAGPFPAINDQITMDGNTYRVTSDRQKPGSAFILVPIES
jgi:hypothetical protein